MFERKALLRRFLFLKVLIMSNKKVNHLKIGKKGELEAVEYLKKLGYKILNKNWFNKKGKRLGEIDIVAKDKNDEIVFVEVKSREIKDCNENINPEEQIGYYKMIKLQKIAESYINENNLWDSNWRFDAVSVIFYLDSENSKIEHFENIFF